MKKILSAIITLLMPLTLFAQQAGDKFTIKTTDGKTTEWSLAGGDKKGDISTLKHNGNKLELYVKGHESDYGVWKSYDINQIESITFSVASTREESAVNAVKNMGLGTNFGNCMDAIDISKTMEKNSVKDFETCWGQVQTTKAMVDFLKKEGFNSVRVPVTWFQHMKSDDTVDEAWMSPSLPTRLRDILP